MAHYDTCVRKLSQSDKDACLRAGMKTDSRSLVDLAVSLGAELHLDGDKLFQWASQHGYEDMVADLLKANVDPSVNNDEALCLSAANGHTNVVRRLVVAGANPAARDNTPLMGACKGGYSDTVKWLVIAGAVPNEDIVNAALKAGHDDIAKFLRGFFRS